MKNNPDPSIDAAELRRRAEQQLMHQQEPGPSGESAQRLLHELQVHQIELEMQNEALREAREEAESALERYTELYDYAPLGCLTVDRGSIIRRANLAAAGLLGLERGKLSRRNVEFFIESEDIPVYRALLARVFAGGAKETRELALTHKGKSPRFLRLEASADETGQNCRVAMLDITELKQTVQTLKENEEKFRSIYEGSNDAIMLLTGKGYFDCNTRTLEMFGMTSKDELLFLHPFQVSPPMQPDGRDSFSSENEKIATAFKQGSNHFEWVHRRKNGEDFPVEALLSAFDYQGKRVLQAHRARHHRTQAGGGGPPQAQRRAAHAAAGNRRVLARPARRLP
ncbi:MAG: PAS domain S-box protein [Polaromonas sp.]|nr:PAS domain S-box protein [Polaromonas sp.]